MSENVLFSIESVIRGYHEYKDVWVAVVGELMLCTREPTNWEDQFAVAVTKDSNIVGHVPRKISALCTLFLRQSGSITCPVTGSRQYSRDLSQGGLEVPCILTFSCASKDVNRLEKVRGLIKHALSFTLSEISEPEDPLSKVKIEASESMDQGEDESSNDKNSTAIAKNDVVADVSVGNTNSTVLDLTTPSGVSQSDNKLESLDWLRAGDIRLTQEIRYKTLRGDKLNDLVINFVQKLLKKQFPLMKGSLLYCNINHQKHPIILLFPRYRLFIVVVTTGSLHRQFIVARWEW